MTAASVAPQRFVASRRSRAVPARCSCVRIVLTIRRKLMPRSSIFEPSGTEISARDPDQELVQREPLRAGRPRARCDRDPSDRRAPPPAVTRRCRRSPGDRSSRDGGSRAGCATRPRGASGRTRRASGDRRRDTTAASRSGRRRRRHCGGLTPSLLTWIRGARSVPSGAACAPMNTYSPTTRSARVPGTARTIGASAGTTIFLRAVLVLQHELPLARRLHRADLGIGHHRPGHEIPRSVSFRHRRREIVDLDGDERAVRRGVRRRADVVARLDVLETGGFGDGHGHVGGKLELQVAAIARLDRERVGADGGDGAAYAHIRLGLRERNESAMPTAIRCKIPAFHRIDPFAVAAAARRPIRRQQSVRRESFPARRRNCISAAAGARAGRSDALTGKCFRCQINAPPRARHSRGSAGRSRIRHVAGAQRRRMNIVCIGGGPAGLYFGILMKKQDPRHEVVVIERNRPYDTFGWGVVFSDQTLGNLVAADEPTARTILQAFNHWDDIDVFFKGRKITSGGHGFCGIGRKRLLNILQARCEELGVKLVFETNVTDERAVAAALWRRPRGRLRRRQQRHPHPLQRDLPAGDRRSAVPLRLARHQASASTRSRSRSRRRSTAGSRRTSTSSTARRRPSSSRRPRKSGGARASTG